MIKYLRSKIRRNNIKRYREKIIFNNNGIKWMRSKNINFVSHYFHNYFQLLTFTNHPHYIHYFFLFSFSYICMLESAHCYTFRRFKNYTWKIDHSISHNPKRVIIKKFSFFFYFSISSSQLERWESVWTEMWENVTSIYQISVAVGEQSLNETFR